MPRYTSSSQQRAVAVYSERCHSGKLSYPEFSRLINLDFLHLQVLISLIPVAHAQGSPKAVVSITPDTHVFTGERVTLRCDIQGGGDTQWTYSWYKNNRLTDSTVQEIRIWSVAYGHHGDYTCRGQRSDSQSSEISDAVTLTVSEKPKPTVRVNPQSSVYTGDNITLTCELQQSTGWKFQWYKNNQQLQPLSTEQTYTLKVTDNNEGETEYKCRACRINYYTGFYYCTQRSDPVRITERGESPPVSLIINPSRTQHFTNDSLSLSCEDQSKSTGWRVRRYTHSERVLDCSRGSITGSTCKISSLSTSYTGVYWCESESGENSNPVNITVHDGDVILESPVHPVTEGHPLTLRCLYRYPKSSNLRADFYKDGSVLQTQTTGEMIIRTVSKSDEGFYHCKHPERGESLKSWVSVRASGPSGVEAPFSVLMLISSVVTASPYLLVTIILLVKCYRARAHTDEERIENAVIEE
ncbi:carcinoembryonic antigen-related cell adhesion molecule 5-like [Ictalurus punctatus]|uniref:Carcinoembryonic antigen-related cell adhesion molecule 5-like n=1 Tax=Ictalurus punctatus TaxID=7998 RepID=A0A9F7TLZ9_ICTPU|nr:carcinoembryonic antigen-related cell adhesion molecule 5-like [Ictalurus punctatus]